MPRQLDFHTGAASDILVLHDTAGGRISIVIEQSSGIGAEAILTSDQAAQLVEDLQRELRSTSKPER